MAYRLKSGEPVDEGVRRIALEQIDAALAEVLDPELPREDAVHQVRKRCKKIRGLLRLVRSALGEAYARENAWFRDAARALSGVRDAASVVEAFDALTAKRDRIDSGQVAAVRAALVARRDRLSTQQTEIDDRLGEFAERMGEARARVPEWSLSKDGFAAVAGGLELTYRRGREAMREAYAEPTPESFHEWRKRVKYGWYHHRLLRDLWKPVMKVRAGLYAELADLLGSDHDLVLLGQTLESDAAEFGGAERMEPLLILLERRRHKLQKKARKLGGRLYAEKPKAFRRRMGAWWGERVRG